MNRFASPFAFQAVAAFGAVLVVFAPALLPRAAQAQESLSPGAYQQLLRDYQKLSGATHASPSEIAALAQKLRAVKTVSTGSGGAKITVDLSPDADALTAEPGAEAVKNKKPREMALRRATILKTLVIPEGSPAPDTANAKNAAQAILARPEFQVSPEAKPPGWQKAVQEWQGRQQRAFNRWLRDLLERWLGGAKSGVSPGALMGFADFVRFLLYFAAGVAALIGLYYLGLYLSGKKMSVQRKGKGGATGLDLDFDAFPDPLGYARDVAARGDYREAVRLVYIASLRRLAGGGLVTLQENRTNWEYQRALRSRSQAAYDTLLPGTRLFDRIWYGRQNATKEEYEQSVALHDALPAPVVSSTSSASAQSPASGSKGGNNW